MKAQLAKRLTTHGLRHTFASRLVMRGLSLMAVKESLGHETITVTELRSAGASSEAKRTRIPPALPPRASRRTSWEA